MRFHFNARRAYGRERSLVDAFCEGDFNPLPQDVQHYLRALANHRFFPTVEAQWAAAAAVLEEYRDAAR
jgi:hypothetical protein